VWWCGVYARGGGESGGKEDLLGGASAPCRNRAAGVESFHDLLSKDDPKVVQSSYGIVGNYWVLNFDTFVRRRGSRVRGMSAVTRSSAVLGGCISPARAR
jgi:hypothetical protein